jgi:hypothetical protein
VETNTRYYEAKIAIFMSSYGYWLGKIKDRYILAFNTERAIIDRKWRFFKYAIQTTAQQRGPSACHVDGMGLFRCNLG